MIYIYIDYGIIAYPQAYSVIRTNTPTGKGRQLSPAWDSFGCPPFEEIIFNMLKITIGESNLPYHIENEGWTRCEKDKLETFISLLDAIKYPYTIIKWEDLG